MNVSFKGVKNVGFATAQLHIEPEMQNPTFVQNQESPTFLSKTINMQFTDDFNGKHLSQYKTLMKKHPEFKNQVSDNALNLMTFQSSGQVAFVVNNKNIDINAKVVKKDSK